MRIAIVGVGLIGGSIGLAARERLDAQVAGFDPAPGALDAALEVGAIDRAAPSLAEAVAGAEAAFVAVPVGALPAAVRAALAAADDDCVVTDVGSTKRTVLDAVDDERATVSHLPHVLANVLVAQAARARTEEAQPLPATGPSFRDITRVAGSNTAIWRDIYLANADALIEAIDDATERLQTVRRALRAGDGDALATWNDAARDDRGRLLEDDFGGDVTELRVAVPNRPGVVAEVALALGRASINIVDMALYPAPDNSSGYIVLWIAGAERAAQAEALVAGLGLPVASA